MDTSKLIMVVGLPGTGKSTFSRALAAELDARHLNSDVIRTELNLRGKYSPKDKAKVYEGLKERTEALLNANSTVIVDATLYREDLRRTYAELARRLKCPIHWLELNTGEESIKERVSKQRPYSEADLAVYQKIKTLYEPLKVHHLSLKTDAFSLEALVKLAKKFINHESPTN
jgi:predicted kinase